MADISDILQHMFDGLRPESVERDHTITRLKQINKQQAEELVRLRDRMSQMADRNLDLRNELKAKSCAQ
jgi:hypothetical protein